MSGGTSETKLVNFAMANKARRKIINFLANCDRCFEEIEGITGKGNLEFHLKILQEAGLIELEEGNVKLSEYGKSFLSCDINGCRPAGKCFDHFGFPIDQ